MTIKVTKEGNTLTTKLPFSLGEYNAVIKANPEKTAGDNKPDMEIFSIGDGSEQKIGSLWVRKMESNPNSNYYGLNRFTGQYEDLVNKKKYNISVLPSLEYVKESDEPRAKAKKEDKKDKDGQVIGQQAVAKRDENGAVIVIKDSYFGFAEPKDEQEVAPAPAIPEIQVPDVGEIQMPF